MRVEVEFMKGVTDDTIGSSRCVDTNTTAKVDIVITNSGIRSSLIKNKTSTVALGTNDERDLDIRLFASVSNDGFTNGLSLEVENILVLTLGNTTSENNDVLRGYMVPIFECFDKTSHGVFKT
tara:strand:+ start:141 stop:509 length:369 start_codon:yes stop_codon:yes gene_type:complete